MEDRDEAAAVTPVGLADPIANRLQVMITTISRGNRALSTAKWTRKDAAQI